MHVHILFLLHDFLKILKLLQNVSCTHYSQVQWAVHVWTLEVTVIKHLSHIEQLAIMIVFPNKIMK